MSWPVAFRVDADAAMGAGHFMRCLSLAHACRAQGGEPVFFSATPTQGLIDRVQDAGYELVQIETDAPDLGVRAICVWASNNKRSWVVLDGYQFNGAYQLAVAQAGARLMVIDDSLRLPRYHADLMLDQNLGSEDRRYPVATTSRVLLGPRYALLAPGFVEADSDGRTYPDRARKLLITLGASDSVDATSKVLSALVSIDMSESFIKVVIGGANQRRAEVRRLAEDSGYRVVEDATDMPSLMADADLAITAAGSTSWEVCRMGLPAITITLADNQRDIAAALSGASISVDLGWHNDVTADGIQDAVTRLISDQKARERMGTTGQKLVDGQGASRVVNAMIESQELS
jgi:UDP-2,4-diacetamido-2,4,6-trideoxy-beta-L-altropyranose hydrolase